MLLYSGRVSQSTDAQGQRGGARGAGRLGSGPRELRCGAPRSARAAQAPESWLSVVRLSEGIGAIRLVCETQVV